MFAKKLVVGSGLFWPFFKNLQPSPGPSPLFGKFAKECVIRYYGRIQHEGKPKWGVTVNSTFNSFMELNPLAPLCDVYKKPRPTNEAAYVSFMKYDLQNVNLNLTAALIACEWTEKHFYPYLKGAQVLPLEDVLAELNKQSSCGAFLNQKYQNKKEYFDNVPLDDLKEYLNNPFGSTPMWKSTLKDEVRHQEKFGAIEGLWDKIRTFTASPLFFTVLVNMYCLDFNEKFYDSQFKTCSAVGMSKYGLGFNKLYQKLRKFTKFMSLDGDSFDAHVARWHLIHTRELRDKAMGFCASTMLEYIYDNIISSFVILPLGDIVQKDTGNPSGSPNTVVDNTIALFRTICYIFVILCWEQEIAPDYDFFMENVILFLYGDDQNTGVSDQIASWFNPSAFKRIGLTMGQPFTGSENFVSLDELDFLGHRYVKEGCFILPAPDTSKILSSLKHGAKYNDIRMHYLRACALYVESWANIDCRVLIGQYLDYLERKFGGELYQTYTLPNSEVITEVQLRVARKADSDILALYVGLEGPRGNPTSDWFPMYNLL